MVVGPSIIRFRPVYVRCNTFAPSSSCLKLLETSTVRPMLFYACLVIIALALLPTAIEVLGWIAMGVFCLFANIFDRAPSQPKQ